VGYFRFRRRIRIARGVTINLGKRGASVSAGPRGLKTTVGPRGRRFTVGLPGTGLSYTQFSSSSRPKAQAAGTNGPAARIGGAIGGAIGWVIGLLLLGGIITIISQSCAGSVATPTPGSSSAPVAVVPTETPTPTIAPVVLPKATKPPTLLSVRVTSLPAVRDGGTAHASIKTVAGARCSIDVEYASGSSHAAGLDDKTAPSTGILTWTWRVGATTTKGKWPVTVACLKGSSAGEAHGSLTVH
jgi:Protein of unknown function (DUF4236)